MIEEKVALVTGASSGIGKEIAIQLAKEGILVYVNFSTSRSEAENTVKEIINNGGKALSLQADVTKEEDIKVMFAEIEKSSGHLDILINNAGVYIPEYIESHSAESWDKIMDTNLKGKFLCTKYATPLLKKSNSPKIINIATRSAVVPMEESVAYCAAASGIVMLTKVSALELAKYNIKVNAISPGLTQTKLTEEYDTQEDFEQYAKANPSKRMGTTNDIAQAVLFLISDKADFINGENLNVSGGILLK